VGAQKDERKETTEGNDCRAPTFPQLYIAGQPYNKRIGRAARQASKRRKKKRPFGGRRDGQKEKTIKTNVTIAEKQTGSILIGVRKDRKSLRTDKKGIKSKNGKKKKKRTENP